MQQEVYDMYGSKDHMRIGRTSCVTTVCVSVLGMYVWMGVAGGEDTVV